MIAADEIVDHPMIDWIGFRGSDVDLTAALLASSPEKVADVVEEISQIDGVRSIKVITFLTVLKAYGFRLQAADELRARIHENKQNHKDAAE